MTAEEKAIKRINDAWIMETAALAAQDKDAYRSYHLLKIQLKGLLEDLGYRLTWDREKGYKLLINETMKRFRRAE